MSKIIVKRPNEKAEVVDVTPGLEFQTIRQIVGGYLTYLRLSESDTLAVFCDEDGQPRRLPYNCNVGGVDFLGTIVIAEPQREGCGGIPLDRQDELLKLFNA